MIKNIRPPAHISNAMARQMKAEREKRAKILESEGRKAAAFRDTEARERSAEARATAVVSEAIAELLALGYFLIWLAAAALLTGVVAAAGPIGFTGEIQLFALLCAAALGAAKRWPARGPDSPPGTRMRITGSEGTVLIVEHLH